MLGCRRIFIAVATLVGLVAGAITAQAGKIEEPWLNVRIGNGEAALMRDYYRSHPVAVATEQVPKKMKRLPPGLQKKAARGKALPPGWQKKIARGEVMDRQIYAHAQPLPMDLVRSLPPQPAGVVTVQLEGKVVRLAEATLTILDVLDIIH
jgi:hypothetical protein